MRCLNEEISDLDKLVNVYKIEKDEVEEMSKSSNWRTIAF